MEVKFTAANYPEATIEYNEKSYAIEITRKSYLFKNDGKVNECHFITDLENYAKVEKHKAHFMLRALMIDTIQQSLNIKLRPENIYNKNFMDEIITKFMEEVNN